MSEISRRNRQMVEEAGGNVMPYSKLPLSAQLALLHYMAEGQDISVSEKEIEKDLERRRFGYAEIPTGILIEQIMSDEEIVENFPTFDDYHAWYVRQGHMPDHSAKNRWPVILSPFGYETLQDGWHRLHDYYRKGAKKIPVVWFTKKS